MKMLTICTLLFFLSPCLFGQIEKGIEQKGTVTQEELNNSLKVKMALIALSYDDAVALRWAPSKPSVWEIGNGTGYVLERARILPDGSHEAFKPLQPSTIKPWTKEEWINSVRTAVDQKDTTTADYLGLAYTFLYNESDQTVKFPAAAQMGNITQIKSEKSKIEMRYGYALVCSERNTLAAEGLGLGYLDRKVKKGESFIYRVYMAGNSPLYKPDTGYVTVKVEMYDKKTFLKEITPIENEQNIILNWKANPRLSAYYIERSDDRGKSYKKITKVPLVTLRHGPLNESDVEGFQDTNIIIYRLYTYKIIGLSSFATEELVGTITAMGRDRTPPERPFVPQPKHIEQNKVKITWEMTAPVAKDLAGFRVARDTSSYGPFLLLNKTLLPPNTREYFDEEFIRGGINYYVVQAIDTAGNANMSFPSLVVLIDSTPPAAPLWITGKMDSTGVVTLMLKSNREKDFMGYRILRTNSGKDEFSSIIESFGSETHDYSRDTIFHDTVTLKSLTKYAYYRATALDKHYNESGFSEILAVRRPDIVPPVAPVITDVFVTDTSVRLKFVPSASSDTKYHIVFRKIKGAEKWDSITYLSSRDSVFLDRKVRQNVIYNYALCAVDSSGLRSPLSFSISARPYYSGILPPVEILNATYDSITKQITIKWIYKRLLEPFYFVIYRSFNKNGLTQYARINDMSINLFTDNQFETGKGEYEYAIKVFNNYGGESKRSKAVSVVLK